MQAVQVVAHRGSSGTWPEHTVAAYQSAIDEGADALECDVRLTRDGVLVCVHDRRVDRTSDGRGVVSTLELAELAELDFASWKLGDDGAEEVDRDLGQVLTLRSLLDLVLGQDHPVQLQVETKHPTRYAGVVERALVGLLEEYGLARPSEPEQSRVSVLSFAATSLRRIHSLAPGLPTQLNLERVPLRYRDGSLPPRVGTAGLHLPIALTHPRLVQRLRGRGKRVAVFTVDEPADIERLLELGVDAVITNYPARVRELLGRR